MRRSGVRIPEAQKISFVQFKHKLVCHFPICFSMGANHIFICMQTEIARVLTIDNDEAVTSWPAGCWRMTSQ